MGGGIGGEAVLGGAVLGGDDCILHFTKIISQKMFFHLKSAHLVGHGSLAHDLH